MDELFKEAAEAQMKIKQLKTLGDPDGCLEDMERELHSAVDGLMYEKVRIINTIKNLENYERREQQQ